jgi:hypothetical protein
VAAPAAAAHDARAAENSLPTVDRPANTSSPRGLFTLAAATGLR